VEESVSLEGWRRVALVAVELDWGREVRLKKKNDDGEDDDDIGRALIHRALQNSSKIDKRSKATVTYVVLPI
jgi:hypothetical protein